MRALDGITRDVAHDVPRHALEHGIVTLQALHPELADQDLRGGGGRQCPCHPHVARHPLAAEVRLTGEEDPRGVAVAVDRVVIPRSEWATTVALAGSLVEVVTAAPGG